MPNHGFELVSDYKPTGDQPEAIEQLVQGIRAGQRAQVLQGVTGSGKTFTVANVIAALNRPTLVMSHNKTLAAQLYGEFKQFFPNNAVEYFVSYYDYYQPEAYIPSTNTYIEKDLDINDELDRLRLRASSALLGGRRDVIVVCSVSCIYGIGNPEEFKRGTIHVKRGERLQRQTLLLRLLDAQYVRNEIEFVNGRFRVKGETIDIYPSFADFCYRISFWDDEVDRIESFDPVSGQRIDTFDDVTIYPASNFITNKDNIGSVIQQIQHDMFVRRDEFEADGRHLEAKRLEERVNYDLEMIQELGYCSGIENYSTGGAKGSAPSASSTTSPTTSCSSSTRATLPCRRYAPCTAATAAARPPSWSMASACPRHSTTGPSPTTSSTPSPARPYTSAPHQQNTSLPRPRALLSSR